MPFIEDSEPAPARLPTYTPPPNPLRPSFGETVAAGFLKSNPTVNVFRSQRDETFPPDVDGHDPLDVIRGTKFQERYLDRFIESRSVAETHAIQAKIEGEEQTDKTLEAAGWGGTLASIAGGTLDPTIALPAGQIYRNAKGGYALLRSTASNALAAGSQMAVQEAALQGAQATRTPSESTANIGSGIILGGLIGTGAVALLSRAERATLTRALDHERSSIDAHARGEPTPEPPQLQPATEPTAQIARPAPTTPEEMAAINQRLDELSARVPSAVHPEPASAAALEPPAPPAAPAAAPLNHIKAGENLGDSIQQFIEHKVEIKGSPKSQLEVGQVTNGPAVRDAGGMTIDPTGWRVTLDSDALRHVARQRGLSMTPDDIKAIPAIVSSPDKIEGSPRTVKGAGSRYGIKFTKRIGDQDVTVVLESMPSKKELRLKTMFKDKVSGEPGETVVARAIQLEDGKVITGNTHPEAWITAEDAGYKKAPEGWKAEGYTTSTGRFVSREQANRIAKAAGQPTSNAGVKLPVGAKTAEEGIQYTPGNLTVERRPGVWANAGHDVPVTILDKPSIKGNDGRMYQQVEFEGRPSFVPADELSDAQAAPPARAPEIINAASYVRPGESVDMGKVSGDVVSRVDEALSSGAKVIYYNDGKPVEITHIDRGMMADAKGQRWGIMSLLAKHPTLRNEIEITHSGEAAAEGGFSLPQSGGGAAADTRRLELEKSGLGFTSKLSPTRRVLSAESIVGRRTMADLAESPYRFQGGEAPTQGPALDRLAHMAINGTRVEISDGLDRLYAEYRFGDPDATAPRMRGQFERLVGRDNSLMTYTEFKKEVSRALIEGDQHSIPQVGQAAQMIRQKVFQPWLKRAQEAGLISPDDVSVKTAESYLQRIYNKEAINANRPDFVNRVQGWLKGDQSTKLAAQQRIKFLDAQAGSWDKEIGKLESQLSRLEAGAKRYEQRAETLRRQDMPKIVSLNEQATGRIADLAEQRAAIQQEMRDLADRIDLMDEIQKSKAISAVGDSMVKRTQKQYEAKTRAEAKVAAKFQEAARAGKQVEARLEAVQARLSERAQRRDLLNEYIDAATLNRDAIRSKIEAEIGAWDGKSVSAAKSALKARAQRELERRPPGEGEKQSRLTAADRQVDLAVKRIVESKRDLTDEELRGKAQEITERILGTPDGRLPYDIDSGGPDIGWKPKGGEAPRGPLARREFNISDKAIWDYLEQDAERIVATQLRTIVPDVMLTERFGDTRMTEALKQVTEEYAARIDASKSEKTRVSLGKERDMVIDTLASVRDRIKGVYGWSPEMQNMGRIANGAKALNNLTSMGMAAVASLSDFAGAIFRHGFSNAMAEGWQPYVRGLMNVDEGAFKQFKSQMRAIGIGIDVVTNARQHALDDIADVYRPQSRFERALSWANDKFFIANLLSPLTDMQKQIASHVAVSEILKASKAAAEGTATKKMLDNLAESGIDQQMAGRIWEQFQKAGQTTDGVHLPNLADWTSRDAANALAGAVNRDVDIMVVTPGQEKPLWMSSPVVSLLGQFKTFTAASTERIVVANLMRRDAAALQGVVAAIGLGMLGYKVNSMLGGQKTSDRPNDWIREGVDRGGILGWFSDANALASKSTRGGVDMYRMIGSDKPLSRFANRSTLDMLLGPTAGKIDSLTKVTGAIGGKMTNRSDTDWTAADTGAVRRLMAFQNMIWLRGAFNKVEEGVNGRLGVEVKH